MKEIIIKTKSYDFAIRIVKLYQYLCNEKKEYVLSKQVLKSGTSVGALIREAEHAESTADFRYKLSIAQKEINETIYWLSLLKDTHYIINEHHISIEKDAIEIIRIITAILRTTRAANN